MADIRRIFMTESILEDKHEFKRENMKFALNRIMLMCSALVIFSPYYFYADFVLFGNTHNSAFRFVLASIHLYGFILSGLFLIFYRCFKEKIGITLSKIIVRAFIIILLLMGSIASINSQRLTGNIDAYIVVVTIAAAAFPYEIIFMVLSLLSNHIIFLFGINIISMNYNALVTREINSTAMLVAATLICYSLYRSRVLEFNYKHKLIESEYNFKRLFSINPLPLFISRYEDGRIIASNDKANNFYGYAKGEFNSLFASDLYKNKDDREKMLNRLNNMDKIEDFIVEHRCKSGINKWVIANYEMIDYYGEDCILTCVTDITELKKMENELIDHASTDSLTGILNRRAGIDLLNNNLDICKKEGTKLVICFIDINGLKSVNDKYGHNEGDILINTVCSTIKDSISPEDSLFRYGGDEFVILFPHKNKLEVEKYWIEIQNKFAQFNKGSQKSYSVGASHGLFEADGSTDLTVEQILEYADKQMYLEKRRLNRL